MPIDESMLKNIEDVNNILQLCLKEIETLKTDQDNKFSLNNVIKKYRSFLLSEYSVLNRDQLEYIENNIDDKLGKETRILYHQALVCQLYIENVGKIKCQNFPQSVLGYFEKDFSKAINFITKDRNLTFKDFQFFSYVQKLCFKCFPVGNHNLVISGCSRNLLFHQSFYKALSYTKTLFFMRGNKPLYELHYNPHRFRSFNPEGWKEVFFLTAQLMVRHPEVKGVFGETWFFDPTLKKISPEIYYIQELIQKIGGKFFFAGSSNNDLENAFAFSKTRKTAYEEGKYLPSSYLMIIPRSVLLSFYRL